METLNFQCRGQWYSCDKLGNITYSNDNKLPSDGNWKFLGVSTHHWHTRITIPFTEIWENPELTKNGIIWDFDHGTIRTWGGRYMGRIPRITACYKTKGEESCK